MCVIYACTDAVPSERELHDGWASNDDGGGVAWKEKGVIRWKKGLLSVKDVLEVLKRKEVKPPLVIHFRTASVGGPIPELTHPFPLLPGIPLSLEGEAPSVFFHNGHWSAWDDRYLAFVLANGHEVPAGPFSDTRAMADMVLKSGIYLTRFLPGKFAVLDAKKGLVCNGTGWYDVDEKDEKGYMQSSSTYGRHSNKGFTTVGESSKSNATPGTDKTKLLAPIKSEGGKTGDTTPSGGTSNSSSTRSTEKGLTESEWEQALRLGEAKKLPLPFESRASNMEALITYTPAELEEILRDVEQEIGFGIAV